MFTRIVEIVKSPPGHEEDTTQFEKLLQRDIESDRQQREDFLRAHEKGAEVHLARAKLREYLERQKTKPKHKEPLKIEDCVTFGPDVPPEIRDEIVDHIRKNPHIFTFYHENGVTLPVRAKPIKIRLKHDAKPQDQARRAWGHPNDPENRILTEWAQEKPTT